MKVLSAVLFLTASATAAAQSLSPLADSYVLDGAWANSNFGTATGLFTKTSKNQNYDSYIKFDTSSVGGVGSVASAKLRVKASLASGSIGMSAYSVSNTTWSETGITWNNKPARGGALSSMTVTGSAYTTYDLDVSVYVIAEKAAGRNTVSFALHNPSSSSQSIWIQSRESGSGGPQLVITANAAPTVSLTAPANNAVFLPPANVTVTATAADSDGTIAKVEFFDGATLLATVTAAPYSTTLANLAAGTHTLTAKATDNLGLTTTSAAVSIRVDAPPSVSIASPASNASFNAPASVPITVTAQDTDGTINRVELYANSTLIATLTVAPYSFNWTNVAAGTYALTAKAVDNNNAETLSAAVTITVRTGVAALYFIHTDHLNTPRLVADSTGTTVWRWDQAEPFGVNVPDENPSGMGAFDLPLRLPGQYFDRETNLAYNFFRDYDSGLGRYIQSDIVGLKGGTNTYSYALQNPIQYVDILGLDVNFCYYSDFPTHIGFGIVGEDAKTQGFYPKRHRSPRGPGIVKPDPNPGDEPRECKTVVATPEQDKCMLACRERRKSNPGTYNGVTRQCTDFVRDCALECNVPVGDHGGPLPKWFYEGIKASDFPE